MDNKRPTIFISHISEEAGLAKILKTHLTSAFMGLVDVFVSSDNISVSAGSKWLISVDSALREACIELVLCSKASVKRPWINFEAGAGWIRDIPVVPVCHSGLQTDDLAMPLSALQSIQANQDQGIDQIFSLIAVKLAIEKPHPDLDVIIEEIKEFEAIYAPRVIEITKDETSKVQISLSKMKEAMRNTHYTWRKVDTLAFIGGVTEGEALDILRNDPDVILSKGKMGSKIAKLRVR